MSLQRKHEDQVLSAVREFAGSLNSGRKVVADISELVEATSPLPLSSLDNWERLIRLEFHQALSNTKPAKWKFWRQPTHFLTWIDLCSDDGFKRERTLRALSGAAPNRFFFAMAVRRLNDWVPQVRAAAYERLLSIANDSDPEDVVDVLCAVFPHWNSWGRMDENGKQILLKITSIETVARSLKSRLVSATAGPLASVLAQAGQATALDAFLPEMASNAIQPSVRAKAYRCLLDRKMVWLTGRKWEWSDIRYCKGHFKPMFCDRSLSGKSPIEETLRAASVDRSPMVRRVAGEVLIRESGTDWFCRSRIGYLTCVRFPSISSREGAIRSKETLANGSWRWMNIGSPPPNLAPRGRPRSCVSRFPVAFGTGSPLKLKSKAA